MKPNQTKPDKTRPIQTRADPTRPNKTRSNQIKPNQILLLHVRPGESRSDFVFLVVRCQGLPLILIMTDDYNYIIKLSLSFIKLSLLVVSLLWLRDLWCNPFSKCNNNKDFITSKRFQFCIALLHSYRNVSVSNEDNNGLFLNCWAGCVSGWVCLRVPVCVCVCVHVYIV